MGNYYFLREPVATNSTYGLSLKEYQKNPALWQQWKSQGFLLDSRRIVGVVSQGTVYHLSKVDRRVGGDRLYDSYGQIDSGPFKGVKFFNTGGQIFQTD